MFKAILTKFVYFNPKEVQRVDKGDLKVELNVKIFAQCTDSVHYVNKLLELNDK